MTTKDLWFVGYTPYYTAGIWFGYDDSTLMRYRLGYNYNAHKVLWKNIMNEVLEGYEDRDFVMPSDVEKLRYAVQPAYLPLWLSYNHRIFCQGHCTNRILQQT